MARLFAQVLTVVFAVVGIGGLFLGDASHVVGGVAQGNLGGLTLHMTWVRDGVDLALAVVFGYVGFIADTRTGAVLALTAGALLLLLGVAGFAVGDDTAATKGAAGMHFPTAVNIFDLVAGALAALGGAASLADLEAAQPTRQR